jgi:hypothetical protein
MLDNNSGYKSLIGELEKPRSMRMGFARKRKKPFSISDDRINELYGKYFSELSLNNRTFRFNVESTDFEEIVYLLRVHFQLWIEIKGNSLRLYQEFPERFMVTKAISKENHPHTPISIPEGTPMELTTDPFGVVNYGKGIPLTGKILIDSLTISNALKPFLQIDYPFIKAIP